MTPRITPPRLPRLPRLASLQAHLSAVMLVATVPLALVLAYHMFKGMQVEHERLNDVLHQHADALAAAVEHELQSSADTLTLLATLARTAPPADRPAADPAADELGALAQALRAALPARAEWHSVYLRHPQGPLLFDSARNAAAPTGKAPPQGLQVATGGPDGLAALEVPWRLADGSTRVLGARLAPAHWQRLADLRRPTEGFAGVLDADGRLVAQAGALDAPLGPALLSAEAPPPPDTLALAPTTLQRSALADGSAVYLAWHEVPVAGWRVAVGRPAGPLDTAQRQATVAGLATIAACLVLGLALATLMARRVTDPLKQLALRGPLPVATPGVQEIAALRDALAAAQAQEAEARASLQRKAAEFETLFASTPIGLAFLRGPQGGTLHNAAMNELLGHADAPHGVGMRRAGRLLPVAEQPLQVAAASGKPVGPLELELVSAGRAPRYVLVQAVPLLDGGGRPQGALATMVDISARKHAEQRVREADTELQQSQRLIELAHEAGEIGFFRVDLQSATWTPGQARLFGVDPARAGSEMEVLLQRIHPDDRGGAEQQLRAMVASRKERETLEFRVILPDGGERWLSNRVQMSFDDDGQPRDLTGATLDITEQKTAELERATLIEREQQARIEAESASRAKDEFLAMLGHELRNPLGAIASATEVLASTDADTDASPALAANARAIITRQTRHLARLVDDLLDVGRVISGKVQLARHPLELAALVRRVAENFTLTGASAQHRVELALQPVWVVADATRLEQVLNNLLGNALKYSPEGTRIDITLAEQGGEAVLTVRDEGEGIAPKLLPHVFDLFVQGERRLDRRVGGLGIGLTLVRRLVELHGGRVRADSVTAGDAQGRPSGSCFTVRLPATEPPTSASQARPEGQRRGRRVLVVEDNADALWAMQAMLEIDGHRVSTAVDGRQGLQALLDEQPEVAIVDIGLPGLTGFEVALRSRRAGFAGTLLALSGYGGERDAAEALRHGFDAHIAKPIDPERLRHLLAQP